MKKTFSLATGNARFSPWTAALLGMVAIKAVLTLAVKSSPSGTSYSGISYLLILLLAAGFSIQNARRLTPAARPFWLLLAAGFGLWACNQFLNLYFEFGLHIEAPDDSILDNLLFFHLTPFMAAVLALANGHILGVRKGRWILNTLLIVGFWGFLYGFIVAPYQYGLLSPSKYGVRFDLLYLIENLVLILMLVVVALRAGPGWKMICIHLLGASALYAASSAVANFAIDFGGYANDKLYGFGLTASACWFVWISQSARGVCRAEDGPTRFVDKQDSRGSALAMLLVVMFSIPMAWQLFHRDENPNVRTLRLIVATAAILLLSGGAYLREYLDKRELAWSFNRRLIQAQEEERIRIARELHDDISQRIVLLALRLEQLNAQPGALSDDTLDKLAQIHKEATTDLLTSIDLLSRRLHAPSLELLGLGAVIRGWCGEFSQNREVETNFDCQDVPDGLSPEISLNLYRVVQEALNNAAKYSGGRSFDVRLWGTPGEIHLRVTDHGKGFDINAAMRGRGIGLKSMRERVRLMKGLLAIESKPNRGSSIYARVPVDSGSRSSQGAPTPNRLFRSPVQSPERQPLLTHKQSPQYHAKQKAAHVGKISYPAGPHIGYRAQIEHLRQKPKADKKHGRNVRDADKDKNPK